MTTPATRYFSGSVLRYDNGLDQPRPIEVAVESPVNIVYGAMPYAVMMTTPDDIEDFVLGFSLTEGVIAESADIRTMRLREETDGFVVEVDLAPHAMRNHLSRRRNLSGRTSCGLCGVENLDQIPGAHKSVSATPPIAPESISRALRMLDASQPLNQRTRAVHAAAWCNRQGDILMAREDVGRHNALDKLIGACLRANIMASDGFIVITSRCSFEMIEKAAIFGATALVSISAPTSLAIDRAKALGVALFAIARLDSAIVFSTGQDEPQKAERS